MGLIDFQSLEDQYDIECSLGELGRMREEISPLPRESRLKFHRLVARMESILKDSSPRLGKTDLSAVLLDCIEGRSGTKVLLVGNCPREVPMHSFECERLLSNCLDHIYQECQGHPKSLRIQLKEEGQRLHLCFRYSRVIRETPAVKSLALALALQRAGRYGGSLSLIEDKRSGTRLTLTLPRSLG